MEDFILFVCVGGMFGVPIVLGMYIVVLCHRMCRRVEEIINRVDDLYE